MGLERRMADMRDMRGIRDLRDMRDTSGLEVSSNGLILGTKMAGLVLVVRAFEFRCAYSARRQVDAFLRKNEVRGLTKRKENGEKGEKIESISGEDDEKR